MDKGANQLFIVYFSILFTLEISNYFAYFKLCDLCFTQSKIFLSFAQKKDSTHYEPILQFLKNILMHRFIYFIHISI